MRHVLRYQKPRVLGRVFADYSSDTGQFTQWGMQMGAGVLSTRSMAIHTTASGMCQKKSDLVGTGKACMQG